jgi:large subunit ribosomal protein L30
MTADKKKAASEDDRSAGRAQEKGVPANSRRSLGVRGEKSAPKLVATLMKSTIGALPQIKATVESLGFRRLNQTRELPDNPAVRGMLKAVDFLVAVEGQPYVRPKRSKYKIWRSRSNKKHQRGK